MLARVGRDPFLTVIEGGTATWRADEARVEVLAFFDEVKTAASDIVGLEASARVPSLRIMNIAGRMGHRAMAAKAEYLTLTGPEAA